MVIRLYRRKLFHVLLHRVARMFNTEAFVLFAGVANWVRNNSFIDKVKNLESITKKGNKDLESITEEGSKYLSQIKSAMTLLIEK